MTDVRWPGCARCRPPTCRCTAAARSPTSTTPACPTWTGSAARRSRRTPARTASTRPRSRRCWRWRTTWSASPATCSTRRPTAVGSVTSGGTESVLLAVQGARDSRPDVDAADDGAAVDRARGVPQGRALLRRRAGRGAGRSGLPGRRGGDGRRDRRRAPCSWSRRRRRTRTASSTRCPRSRPRPPRAGCAATSTRASAAGCCRTPPGWGAPCRRGRSRSTASPRSRWTCTSTPTPRRARRCCCTGRPELRRPQYFASADWPGYTMLNSTMQSTKSGGPLAGAWAVVQSLGDDGLPAPDPRGVRGGGPDRRRVSPTCPGSTLVVPPGLDAGRPGRPTASCDAFTVCDEMTARGWYVQPQMSFAGQPPTIHLSVSAGTLAHVDEFLAALGEAVAAAGRRRAGRGRRRRGGVHRGARPGGADRRGLRRPARGVRARGRVGVRRARRCPTRMAEVNAMLDLASPAMREALLVAFLDRLQRPVRG